MPIIDRLNIRFNFSAYEIGLIRSSNRGPIKTRDYSLFYQEIFSASPKESIFQRLSNGALKLRDTPYKISISHKSDILCLARAKSADVLSIGCDLESLSSRETQWTPFLGRFFSALDMSAITLYKNSKEISLNESYLVFFCIKEAILKCINLKKDPMLFSIGYEDKRKEFFIHKNTDHPELSNIKLQIHYYAEWIMAIAYKIEPSTSL